METKKHYFNTHELTKEQYYTLSWLAYHNRNVLIQQENGEDISRSFGGVQAVRTIAESVLLVPYPCIYDVTINNYCKGLINFNRMASTETWEY